MRVEPSPSWDFGNNTSLEDYTDIAFVAANCLILLITSVVGVAANIFVIIAVYHQKSLQTWNNALVVNLAVIDILRCAIDCPLLFTIVITVHERGHADELICDAQVASFSFSCCIQLLTLACISAERYQAIAQPFKISQRRKRIMVLIPLTWTLAILVAGFCLTFVRDSPVQVKCKGLPRGTTSDSYDTFGLYILFPLWAACFAVIVGFYARIFFLVRSHNRKIFDKGIILVSKSDETAVKQTKEETEAVEVGCGNPEQSQNLSKSVPDGLTQVEPNSSNKGSTTAQLPVGADNRKVLTNALEITDLETGHQSSLQIKVETEEKPRKTERSNPCDRKAAEKPSTNEAANGVNNSTTKPEKASSSLETVKQSKERSKTDTAASEMKETRPHLSSPAKVENPGSTSVLLSEQKQPKKSNRERALPVVTVDQASSLPPVSVDVPETEAAKQDVEAEGAVCMMPSKTSKERVKKKKESKMAKRAGYIIITFLLFWLPLITSILVNLVIHKNKNSPMLIITQHVDILLVSVACITSLSDPIIYAAVNPQFRTEFCRIKNRVESIFNLILADFSAVPKHCRAEALHAGKDRCSRHTELSRRAVSALWTHCWAGQVLTRPPALPHYYPILPLVIWKKHYEIQLITFQKTRKRKDKGRLKGV
ncbi:D(2) dopamine receptor A-like [Xyrichtys novacula]|uniref:D(2) dopamine receptor A-like n=1 Tax=Xyrichtys novacula TaxID=13765 RepID=A0AAV1F6X6_XYRNO|nr:D(2) dopamine receptor A-like [Xyrichtys novacula]